MPSLVEIGPVVLEKKMKMWKVYDNNDDDNGQIEIGSGEEDENVKKIMTTTTDNGQILIWKAQLSL